MNPNRLAVRVHALTRPAFTLIALLVVIAIIGILSSLLLPVLGRGKRSVRSAACVSNIHQIGIGLMPCVEDNRDRLPVCVGHLPVEPLDELLVKPHPRLSPPLAHEFRVVRILADVRRCQRGQGFVLAGSLSDSRR